MKYWKILALALAALLCGAAACAAEWPEGLSAAQPYMDVGELDLTHTMGYMLLYPQAGDIEAEHFCDTLKIWLPREDIALGEGTLTLFNGEASVYAADFADKASVTLRPMEDAELERLLWGGGTCVEIRLPFSLRYDGDYCVFMDEGCYTAANGALKSLEIAVPEAWRPAVSGDYGVSGMRYVDAAEDGGPRDNWKVEAGPGDIVCFDLVMGGEAEYAVVYSENDSVYFEELEYTQSGAVTGTVTGDALSWGVVFLNENGDVLEVVSPTE